VLLYSYARDEIDSVFLPIFEQIHKLVGGQVTGVWLKRRAKFKVLLLPKRAHYRQYSWLEDSDRMSIYTSISKESFRREQS
jgi:hypothetical protein